MTSNYMVLSYPNLSTLYKILYTLPAVAAPGFFQGWANRRPTFIRLGRGHNDAIMMQHWGGGASRLASLDLVCRLITKYLFYIDFNSNLT